MQLKIINNPNESEKIAYEIARIVFAETKASSLLVVEALTSMISNLAKKTSRTFEDIVEDSFIFESLNVNSENHKFLQEDAGSRAFQMCLRVAQRMLRGNLPDKSYGATMFHRANKIPAWATARGYIAEIDDLLFYL